jgi:hypothetical protein
MPLIFMVGFLDRIEVQRNNLLSRAPQKCLVHRSLALRDPLLPVAAHYPPSMDGNFAGWTPVRPRARIGFKTTP